MVTTSTTTTTFDAMANTNSSTTTLPIFATCEEAERGILALPRYTRWDYDCARICVWECGGNCDCPCPLKKWSPDQPGCYTLAPIRNSHAASESVLLQTLFV